MKERDDWMPKAANGSVSNRSALLQGVLVWQVEKIVSKSSFIQDIGHDRGHTLIDLLQILKKFGKALKLSYYFFKVSRSTFNLVIEL